MNGAWGLATTTICELLMYCDFYGFSAKPFQLTPDPAFFFAADSHQRALSYLRYGLVQAEGYIVVTGPVGTGKSTLARHLLNELGGEAVVVAQLVSTNLLPGELLLLIAREFGIASPGNDKAALLEGLQTYLVLLHRQGRRALLIVDESQNLPAESIEELRMLSNFQVGNKPLLQSFLLGQEELRAIIDSPQMVQFRQRIIAQCHLEALTLDELKNYVEFRLSRVGWQGFPEFDADIWPVILRYTAGIPRRINLFCDRLLLLGYLEDRPRLDGAAAEMVAADLEPAANYAVASPQNQRQLATNQVQRENKPTAVASPAVQIAPEDVHLAEPWPGLLQAVHYLDRSLQEKLRLLQHLDEQIAERYQQIESDVFKPPTTPD